MKTIILAIAMMMSLNVYAAKPSITIQGSFGSMEGCELAVKGTISDLSSARLQIPLKKGEEVILCVKDRDNAKFTNGADPSLFTDKNQYWISGEIEGENFDLISILEVAKLGE